MSSSADRFQRADTLFDAALDLPAGERAAFVERACDGDEQLRRDVLRLLRNTETAGLFESSALQLAAPLLGDDTLREILDDVVPQRVGPWRVVRALARGGMGTVFEAVRDDGHYEQRVALKLIKSNAPGLIRRFLDERRILARLEHPSIARLIDGGLSADGTPYLAMELVVGEPIDGYCEKHHFNIEQRLRLFISVCEAVAYAHQRLVIHRDIKPGNIFVTVEGKPKLLDFGIAKLVTEADDEDRTHTVLRALTPDFAAPEQLHGDAATTASDVYALGVLLYLLLARSRPYEARDKSPAEMERLICDVDPVRPSAVAPEAVRRKLRGDLDVIVMKALRKDPARRYPSAAALADDLQRYLRGLPVDARPDSLGYRTRKFVRRNRGGVAIAAGFVVLLSGASLRERSLRARAETEQRKAEAASRNAAAVNSFLFGLFEASDPAQTRGDTLTAGELVRRGVARAEMLRGDPASQAHMLEVTAQLYRSLGNTAEAYRLLERALAARRTAGDSLGMVTTLSGMAEALLGLSRIAGADSAARAALGLQRRHTRPNDPAIAYTLHQLGSIAIYRGDLRSAEEFNRQALALREHTLGRNDSMTALSHLLVGSTLRRRGRIDEAEREFERAQNILERSLGADHLWVADAVIQRAYLMDEELNNYSAAYPLYQRALQIRTARLGESHPLTAAALGDLSGLLLRHRDYANAIRLARRRLEIVERAYGAQHPYAIATVARLAEALQQAGRLEEAETLCRQALAAQAKVTGKDHANIAGLEMQLAGILIDRHQYAVADSLLRDAIRIRRLTQRDDSPLLAFSYGMYAHVLTREARYAEADSLLRQAIHTIEKQVDRKHRDVRRLYGWLDELQKSESAHELDPGRHRTTQ